MRGTYTLPHFCHASPSLVLTTIVSTHPTNPYVPRLGFQPADQIIKNHIQKTKAFNTARDGRDHAPANERLVILH
jgi:hypothetical protein